MFKFLYGTSLPENNLYFQECSHKTDCLNQQIKEYLKAFTSHSVSVVVYTMMKIKVFIAIHPKMPTANPSQKLRVPW